MSVKAREGRRAKGRRASGEFGDVESVGWKEVEREEWRVERWRLHQLSLSLFSPHSTLHFLLRFTLAHYTGNSISVKAITELRAPITRAAPLLNV